MLFQLPEGFKKVLNRFFLILLFWGTHSFGAILFWMGNPDESPKKMFERLICNIHVCSDGAADLLRNEFSRFRVNKYKDLEDQQDRSIRSDEESFEHLCVLLHAANCLANPKTTKEFSNLKKIYDSIGESAFWKSENLNIPERPGFCFSYSGIFRSLGLIAFGKFVDFEIGCSQKEEESSGLGSFSKVMIENTAELISKAPTVSSKFFLLAATAYSSSMLDDAFLHVYKEKCKKYEESSVIRYFKRYKNLNRKAKELRARAKIKANALTPIFHSSIRDPKNDKLGLLDLVVVTEI